MRRCPCFIAFRKSELQSIFHQAGVVVELRWKWAFRWQGLYQVGLLALAQFS